MGRGQLLREGGVVKRLTGLLLLQQLWQQHHTHSQAYNNFLDV
jgi:hypothetical protein